MNSEELALALACDDRKGKSKGGFSKCNCGSFNGENWLTHCPSHDDELTILVDYVANTSEHDISQDDISIIEEEKGIRDSRKIVQEAKARSQKNIDERNMPSTQR